MERTNLVGTEHMIVKNFSSYYIYEGVSDPGAVMSGSDLAELISTDFVHRDLIGLGVVFDGNLGRHSAHGCHLAPDHP